MVFPPAIKEAGILQTRPSLPAHSVGARGAEENGGTLLELLILNLRTGLINSVARLGWMASIQRSNASPEKWGQGHGNVSTVGANTNKWD